MNTESLTNNTSPSLAKHVRESLNVYFATLEGEKPVDLYKMVFEEIEMHLFAAVMDHTGNNQSRASEMLGISRSTLRAKLKKYFDKTYCNSREDAS